MIAESENLPALKVRIALTDSAALMPAYSRKGDAGLDLCSVADVSLQPFERSLIPTGVKLSIPDGYAGLLLPRSGHALKHGLTLLNSPGLIDSNYRGEIGIIAYNSDPKKPITIKTGERVAQLLIQKVPAVQLLEVSEFHLDKTKRGSAGFGSSGA